MECSTFCLLLWPFLHAAFKLSNKFYNYLAFGRGTKYGDQRAFIFVCLFVSVCLSVWDISKTTIQIPPNYRYILSVAVAWSSSNSNAVMYFRFCGWLVFINYNGPNRPQSKTTRMFRSVCQVAAPAATSAVFDLVWLDFLMEFISKIPSVVQVTCDITGSN